VLDQSQDGKLPHSWRQESLKEKIVLRGSCNGPAPGISFRLFISLPHFFFAPSVLDPISPPPSFFFTSFIIHFIIYYIFFFIMSFVIYFFI
jgi:hypothetical protein